MHELALCKAIAETATDHAGGRAVRSIHLRIGHFRQVVPETLQFCWEMRTEGTELDGCGLVVDYVPAVVRCRECGDTSTLRDPILLCDGCDGANVELITGEEFLVESIDVEPAPT